MFCILFFIEFLEWFMYAIKESDKFSNFFRSDKLLHLSLSIMFYLVFSVQDVFYPFIIE